ncbi:MAG TPA: outer membrane lipoprotein-sorting protein [Casimicrobiaceae bacterium]|jgi:outer membrane lipoprotein-sorting protein|nr:outer membrane lipoprotein-sorting protein [Casimicrobiaceae bacterium]
MYAASALAQSAQEIVAAADKVRNAEQSSRSTLVLTEYVSGQERSHSTFVLFSKEDSAGNFRNLLQYVEPPRDAGKRVLLDGRSYWFFDPASQSSVRISAQQRLVGQAAIGDVLTVNLAVDYSATLLGTESIDDAARQKRTCWHLELKAATETAVYNRVEYWVEQGTFRPVKGKFYSDSGRLLKIIYYRNYMERLGAVRPAESVIIDAVDSTLATIAVFNESRFQDVPDAWFQRDYLPRLQIR